MNVGRPRKQEERRKYRNLTLTDEVFNGLKKLGNGSASQAVTDLYNDKLRGISTTPQSPPPNLNAPFENLKHYLLTPLDPNHHPQDEVPRKISESIKR